MTRSFNPPVFKFSQWLLAAGLMGVASLVSLVILIQGLRAGGWPEVEAKVVDCDPSQAVLQRERGTVGWWLPALLGLGTAGLGWGARRALVQQRLADAATLYSLETGELVPVENQEAA